MVSRHHKRSNKLRKIVGLQVKIADDKRATGIVYGKLTYLPPERTRGTQENPGFYVVDRHIPIRFIKNISDDRILYIDKGCLIRK